MNEQPAPADDEWVEVQRPRSTAPQTAPTAQDDEWVEVPRPADDWTRVQPQDNYEKMPWGEVASRAMHNAPASAYNNLMAIPDAVMHPSQTASALSDIAGGVKSKVTGWFKDQDPEQKAKDERLLDAALKPYTSMSGFKQALAEDPVSVLSTAAIPLSGGSSLLGKAAQTVGEASKLGKAASVGSKALDVASKAADPLSTAVSSVPKAAEYAKTVGTHAASGLTGVPHEAMNAAYEVGKMAADDPRRIAFETFSSGNENPLDLSRASSNALQAIRDKAFADWSKTQEALTTAATKPVDLAPLRASLDAIEKKMGNRNHSMESDAFKRLDTIRQNLDAREAAGMAGASVQEIDALKRWFYTQMKDAKSFDQEVLSAGYNGARNALTKAAPGYMKQMEAYQDMLDDFQNIEKTLGTSNKTAANAEMMKMLRANNTPAGAQLIERLGEYDPRIPYMIHGLSTSGNIASGKAGAVELISGAGHALNIGSNLAHGQLIPAVLGAGAAGLQYGAQSPHVVSGALKKAGALSNTANGFFAAMPFNEAVKGVAKKAGPVLEGSVSVASPAATNLKRAQKDVERNQNRGGRIGRKSGGRIVRALTAEQLISGLERARNRQKKSTEPILNQPDEAVVRALDIANKHI